MQEIKVIETALRDGQQCLWATRMPTAMMLPAADAFEQAKDKLERMVYHQGQYPQLESNGDGEANQAEDYVSLKGRYLPANVTIGMERQPMVKR